jgi:hypothetical protein
VKGFFLVDIILGKMDYIIYTPERWTYNPFLEKMSVPKIFDWKKRDVLKVSKKKNAEWLMRKSPIDIKTKSQPFQNHSKLLNEMD